MYGEREMPVRLYVVGHVRPETSAPLGKGMNVAHFVQGPAGINAPEAFAAGLPAGRAPYTRIEIYSRADRFTDDLRFVPYVPPGFAYAQVVASALGSWLAFPFVVVALVALLSCAAMAVTMRAFAGTWRGYAALGYWNLLSVFVLVSRLRRLDDDRGKAIRRFGVRKVVAVFSLVFTLMTAAAQALLRWPL